MTYFVSQLVTSSSSACRVSITFLRSVDSMWQSESSAMRWCA